MRKLTLSSLLLILLLSGCLMPRRSGNEKLVDGTPPLTDTFHLLTQYWELTDADHPDYGDVSYVTRDSATVLPGFVFMTDSSVLENPAGKMSYGTFRLNADRIDIQFQNNRHASYQIERINDDQLVLYRTAKKRTSKLVYKATHSYWPDSRENPFTMANYRWAVPPSHAETDAQIRERVKQSVRFYIYYFKGFIKGNARVIDFTGLPNCLHWYSGGIGIDNEKKLDPKWSSCFYSKDQAFKGRQMLEDALVGKTYRWDVKETNWIRQTMPVLQQMYDAM